MSGIYYDSRNISKYQQSEMKWNYEIFAYQQLNATLKLDAPGYLATHKPHWPIRYLARRIGTIWRGHSKIMWSADDEN